MRFLLFAALLAPLTAQDTSRELLLLSMTPRVNPRMVLGTPIPTGRLKSFLTQPQGTCAIPLKNVLAAETKKPAVMSFAPGKGELVPVPHNNFPIHEVTLPAPSCSDKNR